MKTKLNLFIGLMYILLALSMWSCSEQFNNIELGEPDITEFKPPTIEVSSDIVYHGVTSSFMRHQKDPYTLDNFQEAYENLVNGNTNRTLSRSVQEELSNKEQLKPTHYALKIFPKNEAEQWEIERMEDIKIKYIPFDYVRIPEEEEAILKKSRSGFDEYTEKSPFAVTYEDLETVDGKVEDETFIMPILYTVWPCSKPLPENIKYEVDYEVFLPQNAVQSRSMSSISENTMQTLEDEALALALGSSPLSNATARNARASAYRSVKGAVSARDTYGSTVGKHYLPMQNVKVSFELGTNIIQIYTDSQGAYSLNSVHSWATIEYIYQHPKWKVTYDSSTAPISHGWGETVGEKWYNKEFASTAMSSGDNTLDIHRAVNHYYYGSHQIRAWSYDEGIRLISVYKEDVNANAFFTYSKKDRAYITVYNNNHNINNRVIGTVLHELGHFTHYGESGAYNGFIQVHQMIKESFASYAGWYMGESYYRSLGCPATQEANITGQSRQGWNRMSMASPSWYSPLFVDLVDDYNQYYIYFDYNQDPIKNVPHSVLRRLSAEAKDWNNFKRILNEYVGVHYTATELNTFLAPYNTYFSRN